MEIIKSVFHSKSKRYQFIRYCTVGSLAAGIHYGVYFVLQEYEIGESEYCVYNWLRNKFYL